MSYCNICRQIHCSCSSGTTVQNNVNSERAGLPGLSAMDSAIRVGRIPASATEKDFINSLEGKPGDTPYPGPNGNWWSGGKDTGEPIQLGSPQSMTDLFGL